MSDCPLNLPRQKWITETYTDQDGNEYQEDRYDWDMNGCREAEKQRNIKSDECPRCGHITYY